MQSKRLIKMPTADILSKRLKKYGFDYFAKKTDLVNQIAKESLFSFGVLVAVEDAFYRYDEYLQKSASKERKYQLMKVAEEAKPLLFKALFEDDPEMLEELKEELCQKD